MSQKRTAPLEAQFSALLYRSELLQKIGAGPPWYYETPMLRGYREALEAKAAVIPASIRAAPGLGTPVCLRGAPQNNAASRPLRLFSAGRAVSSPAAFLEQYRDDIKALPELSGNAAYRLAELPEKDTIILTTLLPLAASIRRQQNATVAEILEALRRYCLNGLDKVMRVAGSGE